MCAKYQDSNLKTVPWAQKVNFRQKKSSFNNYYIKRLSTLTLVTFHPHQGWKVTFFVFFKLKKSYFMMGYVNKSSAYK